MPLNFPDSSISTVYTDPTSGNTYTFANGSWSITNLLPASKGGTGFASYSQGDILFGNASGTLSKLAAGTSGYVLSTNGSGADPTWILQSGSGLTIASGTNGQIAFYSGSGSSIKGRSGFTVSDSDGTVDITTSDTTYAFNIKGGASVNKFRFDTDGSVLHLNAGTGKSAELRLYTGDYSYYTGFKPNATASVTYILPSDKPSTGTSVLQSDSSGNMTWVAMTASGGGAGTVATPGARYQLAGYYQGTGSSVSGSSTFTNDTSTGIVSITHSTGSTSPSFGALLVSGGVGIAGTLSYYKSQVGVAGTSSLPSMAFIGNTNNPVYLNVLENNSLSFEGYHGQLLSISPDLNSGYVFSVGDISGIPLLRANANANVTANEYGGNFGIGTTNPGSKLEVSGNVKITGTAVTLFPSTTSNYLIMNTGSGGVLRIQTDVVNSRVRMFENMTTTGSLGFFGTSGGTLYLGTDSGTQNGNITIRGNNTTGGGGDQRAAIFTLATATSNGTGSGGTMVFQTSTSGNATILSNILRTRLRIEGAATGTSNYESIIILGDTNSGTAWTSYLRGVDATGTDVAAGEIQIQAGRSTGTGNAQGISFYVSQSAAATTTAVNTASQIGRFSSTGLTINSTTASISTSSGAIIVAGGAGIAGSLNVGALSKFSDHLEIKTQKELRLYNSADTYYTALKAGIVASSSKTFTLPIDYGTGGQFLTTDGAGVLSFTTDPIQVNSGSINQIAFYSSAGSSVSGSSTFTNDTSNGVINITHNTASGSSTSGALVITGGVGIGGSVKIGDGSGSGANNQGALVISGGLGVGGNIYAGGVGAFGGNVSSNGSASSFTNGAGSLTITNRVIKSGAIGLALAGNAGTEGTLLSIRRANVRDSTSSGSYGFVAAVAIKKTSFSTLTAGQTYTNAASVYIEDAPDSSTTGAITTPANTVTITNPYALYVENGRSFFGGPVATGGTVFSKNLGNGDIALENGSIDTPGVLMYWANNKNFGIDTFSQAGSATTKFRIVRDLNESTGAELLTVDTDGVVYTISRSTGSSNTAIIPTYGVRAWVVFDGTGANGSKTINGSGNVSTVTKNGTGDYTITFTTAMPDANYCIQGMARTPSAANDDVALNIKYNTTPSASSFNIATARYGTGPVDCAIIHVSVIR